MSDVNGEVEEIGEQYNRPDKSAQVFERTKCNSVLNHYYYSGSGGKTDCIRVRDNLASSEICLVLTYLEQVKRP